MLGLPDEYNQELASFLYLWAGAQGPSLPPVRGDYGPGLYPAPRPHYTTHANIPASPFGGHPALPALAPFCYWIMLRISQKRSI